MNNFSRFVIFIVVCLGLWWGYDNFLSDKFPIPEIKGLETKNLTDDLEPSEPQKEEKQEPEQTKEEEEKPEKDKVEQKHTDSYIYVYMLTTDKNGNQFLKPVKRPLKAGEDKLTYAVKLLIAGPNGAEKSAGVYTEVPANSHLNSITTYDTRVVIDMASSFAYGGGSDSLYSRLRQLIKTVLANSDKPVYLYLDGKQANVVGGEGLTISQPLKENSLDE